MRRSLEDTITDFIGSWLFIGIMTAVLTLWVLYNSWVLTRIIGGQPFDPYPFVFLNLFLSFFAAYSSPIILMSQNSQKRRDGARVDRQEKMIEAIYHMGKAQNKFLSLLAQEEGVRVAETQRK